MIVYSPPLPPLLSEIKSTKGGGARRISAERHDEITKTAEINW